MEDDKDGVEGQNNKHVKKSNSIVDQHRNGQKPHHGHHL